MSKMAADIEHGGNILRKAVDYFCHLAVKPEFYSHITNDEEFQNSKYASKNYWDEAYYEGYLNGVVLIGACGIDPTAIEYIYQMQKSHLHLLRFSKKNCIGFQLQKANIIVLQRK